jgi:intraflagellar transport protein 172
VRAPEPPAARQLPRALPGLGSAISILTPPSLYGRRLARAADRFYFDDASRGVAHWELCRHSSVPYALSWGESICVAGADQMICFYDKEGSMLQRFDYSHDEAEKEFTVAAFNPSGEAVVVGSFNRFRTFTFNQLDGSWQDAGIKQVDNLYTVTALSWKCDGSRLCVGSLCGAVDMYDACIRRVRYKGRFEFTYVSTSTVIVKRLSSGARIVLKSHFGYEVTKINIYEDRFLVASTAETLLMGDLESCKLSEVPWSGSGQEKYHFDNPQVCMIFNSGELTLIEYGRNEILGSCRTEHMSPHLISVRLSEAKSPGTADVKKVAYLLDLQTIRISDLITGITEATITHEAKVDWMEMNGRATKLLFRDKRRALHLYDIATQTRSTLLSFSSYVQWVPNSDVVVAQNRANLCVWYHIEAPEKVTVVPIKGDVEDIERAPGRTEVIVDEGMNTVSYQLNEALIAFGSAVDDGDLHGACAMLERLELTAETESMWEQLSQLALQREDLSTAERCFGAVGNVSKARYLHKVNNLISEVEAESGIPDSGVQHFRVQSKLAVLNGELARAEQLLVQQGLVEDAMEMYQELHKWEESISVAEQRQHPEVATLKSNYFKWLTQTGQEEKAAEQMEREHDLVSAIHLYLKGGLPARAGAVVIRHEARETFQPALIETIAGQLFAGGMYEKAGAFFERLDDPKRAMDCYRKGQAYGRAVELSRRCFQGRDVVELEQLWGDYLVSCKNPDAAINHFTEAGAYIKAIEAAISCRQWPKAAQIVETLEPNDAKPYLLQIAKHYEVSRNYDEAERFYLRGGAPQDAVEMYSKINKWEKAHRVATTHMTQAEVAMLYITQAHRLEQAGKFKEAEKLYVMVHEPDLAINMHKKNRLVTSYRKELLTETHLHLAQQLETEGNFKLAERHYVEANDWGSAVNMYRANDLWDEAIRVAQRHGGPNASKKVSYAWAVALGGEAGAKLLTKFGLIDQAIDYATESGAFEHAFSLAQNSKKEKLPEVHLKYAMYLEDEGRFDEAEKEFIKADKPKEAIDMYVHQQDWANATRVSETADPGSMGEILVAQAKACIERSEFTKAESLYVRAKKPEEAVKAYKTANRWQDAIRIAKEFLPHKVQELMGEHAAYQRGEAAGGGAQSPEELMARGRQLEEGREFSQAIDAYLQVNTSAARPHDFLEEVWENAVKLAMNHVPNRISEVVEVVSKRLIEIGRFAQAAELFEGIDRHREAIQVYMQGGMWDQARELARQVGPKVERDVAEAYKRSMSETGAAADLVHSGNVAEGIEAYAQKGEWEKCREVAQQQGAHMLVKYATLHGAALIQQNVFSGAAKIFATYGTSPQNVPMYRRLAKEILATGDYDGGEVDSKSTRGLLHLRQMLAKVVVGLRQAGDEALTSEFEQLLWIGHMTSAKDIAEERGASEARRKLSIALLKSIRQIPADRAFYDAGQCCRQANDLSMAFVFLNRYLDISEAMEEGGDSSTTLDNSDFVETGIPVDFPLPEKQFLSDKDREKVRDYVLELSMNEKVQQSLNVADLAAVFKESDLVRDSVLRGGRAVGGSELYTIVRDTVGQLQQH